MGKMNRGMHREPGAKGISDKTTGNIPGRAPQTVFYKGDYY
jgi:hypothetical protein